MIHQWYCKNCPLDSGHDLGPWRDEDKERFRKIESVHMNHPRWQQEPESFETQIQELEQSIFKKESRLKEISIRLSVLESRLDFLSEVSS